MSYKALYNEYRPQTFDEVAGQQHIVKTLKNAIAKNQIAHAYLFAGPRGTGKTTMARLFAKALNCEQGLGKQCNTCETCKEISNGTFPDVIEIDAASNNGVEQVRDLISNINFLPLRGKYKIYIIDEVHVMTDHAFNALLKTLEEPPAHVIFILATTEPYNVLPTILSRCQRYDFNKVGESDMKERIKQVLLKESIKCDDGALNAIISLADGGMRDALSMLGQVSSFCNGEIQEKDVLTLFGLASNKEKVEFLINIARGDVMASLNSFERFKKGGVDIKRLNSDLLDTLKDALIYQKTGSEASLSQLKKDEVLSLCNELNSLELNEFINVFLKTQCDFKTVENINTLFEISVLELCSKSNKVEDKIEKNSHPESPVVQSINEFNETPVQQVNSVANEEPKIIEETKEQKSDEAPEWLFDTKDEPQNEQFVVNNKSNDAFSVNNDDLLKMMVKGIKEERIHLGQIWGEIESFISNQSYGPAVSLLSLGKPFVVCQKIVVVEYSTESAANKANLRANARLIRNILGKLVGRDVYTYGITRTESVYLYQMFTTRKANNSLPSKDVELDLQEIFK